MTCEVNGIYLALQYFISIDPIISNLEHKCDAYYIHLLTSKYRHSFFTDMALTCFVALRGQQENAA
jgi:hypothetical protein